MTAMMLSTIRLATVRRGEGSLAMVAILSFTGMAVSFAMMAGGFDLAAGFLSAGVGVSFE